jgi:hypothetical protein
MAETLLNVVRCSLATQELQLPACQVTHDAGIVPELQK